MTKKRKEPRVISLLWLKQHDRLCEDILAAWSRVFDRCEVEITVKNVKYWLSYLEEDAKASIIILLEDLCSLDQHIKLHLKFNKEMRQLQENLEAEDYYPLGRSVDFLFTEVLKSLSNHQLAKLFVKVAKKSPYL